MDIWTVVTVRRHWSGTSDSVDCSPGHVTVETGPVEPQTVTLFFSSAVCPLRDDTSGEDAEDKEPTVAFKGRRTANSQGRRNGRVTRSMTSEVEETTAPLVSTELSTSASITAHGRTVPGD